MRKVFESYWRLRICCDNDDRWLVLGLKNRRHAAQQAGKEALAFDGVVSIKVEYVPIKWKGA